MQCIKDKTHCKSTKQKNCIKCHLARTIHFYPKKQGNEINISCFNELNRNYNLFRICTCKILVHMQIFPTTYQIFTIASTVGICISDYKISDAKSTTS